MFDAALKVCPDILLHDSDEYMASLINRLSKDKRNILVICGYGQSRTIPYHLYHNPRVFSEGSLDKIVRYSDPFETLLRSDSAEVSVDKLAIVDQILYDNI